MSKILQATSDATGKVTVDGKIVAGAVVLSEGKQASSGVGLLDQDKFWYMTSSATDIVTTIDKLINVLTQLTTVLTAIDSKPTGGAGSAVTPVAVSAVANLNVIKTELTTLKGALK